MRTKPSTPPAAPATSQSQSAIDHLNLSGQRQRAHAATNQILGAAHVWWAGRRPLSFTLHQHLQNPTVNTCGDAEKALAQAVAEWILAATATGTRPDMPFEALHDAAGNVIGYARGRTPLDAARIRCRLSIHNLALVLAVPERALARWCMGKNRPQGAYRVRVDTWMEKQKERST